MLIILDMIVIIYNGVSLFCIGCGFSVKNLRRVISKLNMLLAFLYLFYLMRLIIFEVGWFVWIYIMMYILKFMVYLFFKIIKWVIIGIFIYVIKEIYYLVWSEMIINFIERFYKGFIYVYYDK